MEMPQFIGIVPRFARYGARGGATTVGETSDVPELPELNGAGDRFRTDDLVLGKHALYQLSYTRPDQSRCRNLPALSTTPEFRALSAPFVRAGHIAARRASDGRDRGAITSHCR